MGLKPYKFRDLTIALDGFSNRDYPNLIAHTPLAVKVKTSTGTSFCDCETCRVHIIRPIRKKNEAKKAAR